MASVDVGEDENATKGISQTLHDRDPRKIGTTQELQSE